MTERDRNPDILATADRLAEMTGGLEYRRDAIYDALASASASGAERMRERAILASIAACAEISAHFDEAEFPTQSAGNFVLDGIEEAETAVVRAIRALPLPDPAPVPAWRPKVKALRWAEHTVNSAVVGWNAPSALGAYYIDLRYGDAHLSGPGSFSASFANQEAARAAAQADYERRIRSAIVGGGDDSL